MMLFMFDSDEKQEKHAAARGLSRLRAGLRKSDTQELDYRELAEKQAKLAAEKKQAEQAAEKEHAEPAVVPEEPAAGSVANDVQEQPEESTRERERRILKREIATLQQALQKYGFGFPEMRDAAPKSDKVREQCREVTCVILHEGMLEGLRRDNRLPLKEICDDLDIPALKMEEHKKYIIAVCEILDGDYPYLSGFLGETQERLHETSRLYHRG